MWGFKNVCEIYSRLRSMDIQKYRPLVHNVPFLAPNDSYAAPCMSCKKSLVCLLAL